jgi:hypothetical protein
MDVVHNRMGWYTAGGQWDSLSVISLRISIHLPWLLARATKFFSRETSRETSIVIAHSVLLCVGKIFLSCSCERKDSTLSIGESLLVPKEEEEEEDIAQVASIVHT